MSICGLLHSLFGDTWLRVCMCVCLCVSSHPGEDPCHVSSCLLACYTACLPTHARKGWPCRLMCVCVCTRLCVFLQWECMLGGVNRKGVAGFSAKLCRLGAKAATKNMTFEIPPGEECTHAPTYTEDTHIHTDLERHLLHLHPVLVCSSACADPDDSDEEAGDVDGGEEPEDLLSDVGGVAGDVDAPGMLPFPSLPAGLTPEQRRKVSRWLCHTCTSLDAAYLLMYCHARETQCAMLCTL